MMTFEAKNRLCRRGVTLRIYDTEELWTADITDADSLGIYATLLSGGEAPGDYFIPWDTVITIRFPRS